MPDTGKRSDVGPQLPEGKPSYLWFAGIVEGRRDPGASQSGPNGADGGHDAELRRITAGINELNLGHAELELDGGHFSILLAEETVDGEHASVANREAFLKLLQELLSRCRSLLLWRL